MKSLSCVVAFLCIHFYAEAGLLNRGDDRNEKIITHEIQLALCEPDIKIILSRISDKKPDSKNAKISFFDTNDFIFYANGIYLKRKVENGNFQLDLKSNFREEQDIPPAVAFNQLDCEVDFYQSNQKIGCKIKSQSEAALLEFSKQQSNYLADIDLVFDISDLIEYGPYHYEKWKIVLNDSLQDYSFTLDQIRTKNMNYIELSAKVKTNQPDKILAEMIKWANTNKIKICSQQIGRWEKIHSLLRR